MLFERKEHGDWVGKKRGKGKVQIPALDHGFVEVIRISETDDDIVDYARVTTRELLYVKKRPTKGFINYLLTHLHTSPFEFPDVVVLIKAPMFVHNQWFRHRTAGYADGDYYESTDSTTRMYNSQQQFSGRYAMYSPEFYIPPIEQLMTQAEGNMQASSKVVVENPRRVVEILLNAGEVVADTREELVDEHHLAREKARIITPLNQYITWYWKQNLWNWLHWIKLRREDDAQWEIRQYANIIEDIIMDAFPLTYESWRSVIDGCNLTYPELQELIKALDGKALSAPLATKLKGRKSNVLHADPKPSHL